MNIVKRSFKFILVLFICLTSIYNLPLNIKAEDEVFLETVPEGTFKENTAKVLTQFISKTNDCSVNENEGVVELSKNDEGDHFALLDEEKMYKSFIYEADVEFVEGDDTGKAAGLTLIRNKENISDSSWFAGNVAPNDSNNTARFFRVGSADGNVINSNIDTSDMNLEGKNHLKITMNENGVYTYALTDNAGVQKEVSGKYDDWYGAYLGLITFKAKAKFSSIKVTDLAQKEASYFSSANNNVENNGGDNARLVTEKLYKSFTFEADAKVMGEGDGSAALILSRNKSNLLENWMGMNFHKEENVIKLFNNGTNNITLSGQTEKGFDFDKTIHLSLNVNESGEVSFKVTDFDGTISSGNTRIENWQGAYLGLLSFKSTVNFSNVSIIDHSLNDTTNFKTDLVNLQAKSGNWSVNTNGLNGSIVDGDAIVLSDSDVDDFVYEADVKFNENRGAASIIFHSNDDISNRNMYVANINGESGEARLFKFENGNAIDIAKSIFVEKTENNEYHLKVVMIGKHIVYYINGQLVINTADYTVDNGTAADINSHYGQNDAILSGKLGLMTWNGNVSYQNVKYTEITEANTPQLTDLTINNDASEIDKQIDFMKGQYVYIGYVKNKVTSVSLRAQTGNGSKVVATNSNGEIVDINNLPVNVGKNIYTLTVTNSKAKVIYKVQLHRCQPDENYYNEDYRGQYHYSVKDGWANDPNGMVYFNGTYHLFYQFYNDTTWGPMHWAHATSSDLIHWEEQPIALYPDEYGSMYSGCAVVADHNTAPDVFAENEEGIVLLITANGTNGSDGQRVIMAYSKDGITWEKKEDAKVLLDWTEDTSIENENDRKAFRDPKVFRYDNKWFMVIAGGPLRIYSSEDLINWNLESSYPNLHTECPDLYPLKTENGEVKWVLDRGGRFYKVGDFKVVSGKYRFVPDDNYVAPWYQDKDENDLNRESNYLGDNSYENGYLIDGIMNFGRDYYAAMTYYVSDFGTSGNVKTPNLIAINWMNTWDDYCRDVANKTGNDVFNGTFNLQVKLSLTKDSTNKYLLVQTPIEEYEKLRDTDNVITKNNITVTADNDLFEDFNMSSYEIVANIKPEKGTKEVGFNVRVGNGQKTEIKYNFETETISIDRSKSGIILSNKFAEVDSQSNVVKNDDGSIDLHIYVDRASVEVYSKQNTVSGAVQIFPDLVSNGLEVFANEGNAEADISVYPLKSIWQNKTIVDRPIGIGTSKDNCNLYVDDSEEITAWVSPMEANQEIEAVSNNESIVKVKVVDNKITINGVANGKTSIRISSKKDNNIFKEIPIAVYENNFISNVGNMSAVNGNWIIDNTVYNGSYHDNAFLLTDEKIKDDKYIYQTDLTYTNGIVNFIFNAQSKDVYQGCYAVQIKDNEEVRLFDFKGDHTFKNVSGLQRTHDGKYNVKIIKENNVIKVVINGTEYINYEITDSNRMYENGYAGFGIYNSTLASFENFIIRNERFAELETLINDSTKYIEADYTKGSYSVYKGLINEATKKLEDGKTTSAQVEQLIMDIDIAFKNLISVKELKELIADFEAIDNSLYNQDSWEKFMERINVAKTLINKENVTKLELDIMLEVLDKERNLLVLKEIQELSTSNNQIKLIGQFAENVFLSVSEIVGNDFDNILENITNNKALKNKVLALLFEINLIHNDVEYLPNGNFLIKIKLDKWLLSKEGLQIVYISDDNTVSLLDSYIENDYICFETSHLSKYGIVYSVVTTEEIDSEVNNKTKVETNKEEVVTGDTTSQGMLLLMLILSGAFILKKRKI